MIKIGTRGLANAGTVRMTRIAHDLIDLAETLEDSIDQPGARPLIVQIAPDDIGLGAPVPAGLGYGGQCIALGPCVQHQANAGCSEGSCRGGTDTRSSASDQNHAPQGLAG